MDSADKHCSAAIIHSERNHTLKYWNTAFINPTATKLSADKALHVGKTNHHHRVLRTWEKHKPRPSGTQKVRRSAQATYIGVGDAVANSSAIFRPVQHVHQYRVLEQQQKQANNVSRDTSPPWDPQRRTRLGRGASNENTPSTAFVPIPTAAGTVTQRGRNDSVTRHGLISALKVRALLQAVRWAQNILRPQIPRVVYTLERFVMPSIAADRLAPELRGQPGLILTLTGMFESYLGVSKQGQYQGAKISAVEHHE